MFEECFTYSCLLIRTVTLWLPTFDAFRGHLQTVLYKTLLTGIALAANSNASHCHA